MNTEPFTLSVYYLSVSLKDANPPILRDIVIPSNLTLEKFHYVIQVVMGWQNCHLHQFIVDEVFYTTKVAHAENNLDASDENDYERDERKYTVAQLLTKEKTSFIYEYDFGDSWTHHIELKEIRPAGANAQQPRCISGTQACPPEDSGGVWGYTEMLETLQNAKGTEKEEILERLGKDFNPDYFDVDAVNEQLERLFFSRLS